MTQFSSQLRNTTAALVTAVTLLTGCGKSPEPVSKDQDSNLAKSTLPAAPLISANPAIVALFSDTKIPAEVRESLANPRVHNILHSIWESKDSAMPISYVRNVHAPADGVATVKVLQHLLNNALPPTIEKGRIHHNALLTEAQGDTSRFKEDKLAAAAWMNKYLSQAPAPLKIDGDYGPGSHKLRAFITQVANDTSHFPHAKEDRGANDTAIGPRTLKLLTETTPGFQAYFGSDFAVVALSFDKAAR